MILYRIVILILGILFIQGCDNKGNHEDNDGKEIVKEYYRNGQVKEETPFEGNVKQGVYKIYYEDGNLKSVGRYLNDKIVGDVKFYYNTGELLEVQKYDSTGNISSYVRYSKEGEETKKGAFPKLSISEQTTGGEDEVYFVLDLKNYVFDSVQVIIGPLDSANQFVLDTLELIKCPSGLCKYKIQNVGLGSNIITGVVQDLKYEGGDIVEQNIVPFSFDNYIKVNDEDAN